MKRESFYNRLKLSCYRNAPVLLFLLGVVWVLLFPAVNITTGELKPRGLYVDEHALLVQSQLYKNLIHANSPDVVQLNGSLCGYFDTSLVQCSLHNSTDENADQRDKITQIQILPSTSKITLDTTVLTIAYAPESACIVSEMVSLVHNIAVNLHSAKWNARKVIVLLVPTTADNSTTNSINSYGLSHWLQRNHRPSINQLREYELYMFQSHGVCLDTMNVGMIREAYVLDLTDTELCMQATKSMKGASKASSASVHFGFNSLGLLHTGTNGVLPNMDMLSYPLSMYPDIMHTESEQCALQLHNSMHTTLLAYLDSVDAHSLQATVIRNIFHMWGEIDKNVYMKGYKDRLLGLLCSLHTLTVASPTGLHAHFLHYNIDSVTIQPTRQRIREHSSTKTNTAGSRHGTTQSTARTHSRVAGFDKQVSTVMKHHMKADHGREKLLEVVFSLLYISNNLQEELHHSHFFYILLGSNHFTGISEYGFTAAVFLLSVLLLYLQLSMHCSIDSITSAILYGTLFLSPMAVWIVCVIPCMYGNDTCGIMEYLGDGPLTQRLKYVLELVKPVLVKSQCENVSTAVYLITCTFIALYCASSKSVATELSPPAHVPVDADADTQLTVVQVLSSDNVPASPAQALLTVYVLVLLVALGWVFAQHFALGVLLSVVCILSTICIKSVCCGSACVGTERVKNTMWELGRIVVLLSLIIGHMLLLRCVPAILQARQNSQEAPMFSVLFGCLNALVGFIAAAGLGHVW